jgi:glycosyltransferase involved in cell wall biosynthesis
MRVRLGLVYHVAFSHGPDGALYEDEGSFSRYVESLAPYCDEIMLCVPVRAGSGSAGYRLGVPNVTLAPLPPFDGPRAFYQRLPRILLRLARYVPQWDAVHLRVPTPLAIFAFLLARRHQKPTFLLVVGDLREVARSLNYSPAKALLYRTYVAVEEAGLAWMTGRALTFVNGGALFQKHWRPGRSVYETKTSTITAADLATRHDTCQGSPARLLCVSRVDPRKGLKVLPAVLRLLGDRGWRVCLDIVGPVAGRAGARERAEALTRARGLGVAERLRFLGPIPLGPLFDLYRQYDLFVLPTLPGEGIPRVLLEAMASGLPVVTADVAGIPSLITSGWNGLLVPPGSPEALADALHQLLDDRELRRRLIKNGYETAAAHTGEQQARWMLERVAAHTGLPLKGLG